MEVEVLVVPAHIAEAVAEVGIVPLGPLFQVVLPRPETDQRAVGVIERRVMPKAPPPTLLQHRRPAGVHQAADVVVVVDLVGGLQRRRDIGVTAGEQDEGRQDADQPKLSNALTHYSSNHQAAIVTQGGDSGKAGLVGEIVAILRPSKALQSPSAAFGKFINPTLNGRHATRRTLWPPKRFWVSFCYESPVERAWMVAGIKAGQGHVDDARLGTDERHGLGIGVEHYVEPPFVVPGDCLAQSGQAPVAGVAVMVGLACRLVKRLDDFARRRHIGIADIQPNHVHTPSPGGFYVGCPAGKRIRRDVQ